jgi:hypothetical protein
MSFDVQRLNTLLERGDVPLWCYHCDHHWQASQGEKAKIADMIGRMKDKPPR